MKHHILKALILTLIALMSLPVLTQDDELICDAFADGNTDARTGYYMGEGVGFYNSGEYSRAINSFSCVIEQIDSDYVPAHLSRALAYVARQNYVDALRDYNTAVSLAPNMIAAYNNRGIVHAIQGNYDEALSDFAETITLDGDFIIGYNNRAVVAALQGDYDSAIADLEQALSVSGIVGVYETIIETEPEELPDVPYEDAHTLALLGIINAQQALDAYEQYLTVLGSRADFRIQGAASALESRFNFELRLQDGTWLLTASFER